MKFHVDVILAIIEVEFQLNPEHYYCLIDHGNVKILSLSIIDC